jgi:hypothetical protein
MIGGVKVDHYRGNLNGQLLSSRLVIAIVVEGASCSHTHISLGWSQGSCARRVRGRVGCTSFFMMV